MVEEIISRSISRKVWERARIELDLQSDTLRTALHSPAFRMRHLKMFRMRCLKIFLSLALLSFCSAEWISICNLARGHKPKHLCELEKWFRFLYLLVHWLLFREYQIQGGVCNSRHIFYPYTYLSNKIVQSM